MYSPFRSARPLLTLVSRFCPLLCYTACGPYRTQFADGHGKQGFWALWREYHRVGEMFVDEGGACKRYRVSAMGGGVLCQTGRFPLPDDETGDVPPRVEVGGDAPFTYTNRDKCAVSDRQPLQTWPIEILSHVFICTLTDRGNLGNRGPSHRSRNRHTQRGIDHRDGCPSVRVWIMAHWSPNLVGPETGEV